MKRLVALVLAFCVFVSALSISAFAAGSLLGVDWDSSTTAQTVDVSGSSIGAIFEPYSYGPSKVDENTVFRFDAFAGFEIITDEKTFVFKASTGKNGPYINFWYDVYVGSELIGSTPKRPYSPDQPFVYIDFFDKMALFQSASQFSTSGYTGAFDLSRSPISISGSYKIKASSSEVSIPTFYYLFAPVRRLNGFGSISSLASSTAPALFKYDYTNVYTVPAGSTVSYDFSVSVDGVSGFGSDDCPAVMSMDFFGPDGQISGGTQSLSTYSSVSSGKYIYHFTGTATIPKDFYSFADFLVEFSSSYFGGKTLTVNLESCSVRVTALGESGSVESPADQVINNINNTLIKNNTEVITQITAVIGILNNLFENSVTVNAYLDSLVGEINSMGADLDSILEYLRNMYNQLSHISQVVDAISDQLATSNRWFEQFAGHLIQIQTDVGFCSTYLQGIYNTLSMMDSDIIQMRDYLKESNASILEILKEVQAIRKSLGDAVGNQLDEIIKNLVSQGTSIDGIKSFVATIKNNSTESVKLLQDILDELRKVEAENSETNDRLQAIQDALDDFEINVSKAADKVLSSNDQKGLGALVSKIISHLLSIVDFVTDLFGGIFTSIPSTISAYNECNSFWGDQKTYIYTPHQISGYTDQGGASYENSNDSVQNLFGEAEKYLGYPYVFGGSSPETSFDCSGFVCYSLNQSGAYAIGRTTAQGLYDACTPVDRIDAQPGDLVFFTGTYDCADPVSHVGIYAGDGRMLHCGDPIQYTSIDTSYWQSHFYAIGRLPYNS